MYGEDREGQVHGRRTPREESARGTRRARPWPHRCGRGWRRGATYQEAITKRWAMRQQRCNESEPGQRHGSTHVFLEETTKQH